MTSRCRHMVLLWSVWTLLSLFLTPYSILHAEETIIVGDVVSQTTGEGIAGVNIHFRGTRIGTTTDPTGAFALHVDMPRKAILEFSAVGYHTQHFEIQPGAMAGLQVTMRERVTMLNEVVALPGENLALPLMARVRANRPLNDRTLLPGLQRTGTRTRRLYVSHITRRQLERSFWRKLQSGLIMREDSTYLLPLYRDEQHYELAADGMTPLDEPESKALILTSTDYSSLLQLEGNLNFYHTTIPLMGRPFVSPLSGAADTYYKFYLADSLITDSAKHYVVHFRTRNPYYATFNGSLVIDSASAAVLSVEANVPAQTGVNYLSSLTLSQQFAPDHSLQSEHISALLDFAVKTDSTHYFPTILIDHTLTTTPALSPATHNLSPITYNLSPVAYTPADSAFQALEDSPLMRSARWLATIITTGYIPTRGPLDIGHIQEILQLNDHEGVHVGLPLRTSERLWRNLTLEACVGYGWRDKALKGMGRVQWQLPTHYRNILSLSYRDGYTWTEVDDLDRAMRENSMGHGLMDFTAYAFESLRRDSLHRCTAMRQQQGEILWTADWLPSNNFTHLETRTALRIGRYGSSYSAQASNNHLLPITYHLSPITYTSLSTIARLSWGERTIDGFFRRRYAYSSRYPVLHIGAEIGSWQDEDTPTGSYHLYGHLRAMLTHHVSLGMGGTLDYMAEAGIILGRVPTPMLWHASANEGYAYDPYRYTLLHHFDLMGSRYAALQAEWNGQGILFNLIPGIRVLRLRELVECKLAYASYGSTGQSPLSTFNYRPSTFYAEIGVGLGNILRVCDLYSIWRLTPDNTNPRWALRFRMHIGM